MISKRTIIEVLAGLIALAAFAGYFYFSGKRVGAATEAASTSAATAVKAGEEFHAAKKEIRADVRAGDAAGLRARILRGAAEILTSHD